MKSTPEPQIKPQTSDFGRAQKSSGISGTQKSESDFGRFSTGDDTPLDMLFAGENASPSDVIKELFAELKVKARTDLSARQISKISRVYYLAELLKMPELTRLMNEFITLRISKDRSSRKEFVEGLKAKLDNQMMQMQSPMLRNQYGK